MKLSDLKVGDRVDYTPVTCVPEHSPLVGVVITGLEGAGFIFNQPMITCDECDSWMPLLECRPHDQS